MTGIYGIHNTLTDMWYVGQSVDISSRWYFHRTALNHNYHHNIHLQRAYNKYQKDAFEWVILEECSPEKLNEREIFWIAEKDSFRNGYNRTLGGDGGHGTIKPNRKPVVLLDTGEIFESILAGAKHIGVPRTRLKGCIKDKKSCHGYWELLPENYSEEWRVSKLMERKQQVKENRRNARKNRKKKPPYVNPNGYHKWSEEAKLNNKGKNGKPVVQLTLSGEFIAEYPSSVMAGEALGINHRKIRMVCNGERNKCGGFRWKWKERENT